MGLVLPELCPAAPECCRLCVRPRTPGSAGWPRHGSWSCGPLWSPHQTWWHKQITCVTNRSFCCVCVSWALTTHITRPWANQSVHFKCPLNLCSPSFFPSLCLHPRLSGFLCILFSNRVPDLFCWFCWFLWVFHTLDCYLTSPGEVIFASFGSTKNTLGRRDCFLHF